MFCEDRPVKDDCPVCGKKEGANRNSSEWYHNISCCSDECGEKAREIIEQNTNSKKFKKLCKKYYKLEIKLRELTYEGLKDPNVYFDVDRRF